MYEYLVYLFMINKPIEKIKCKSRMEADILREVAIQDGYYKYQLVIRDIEQDMPIDTYTEYFDTYKVTECRKPNKTRKRKGR